MTARILPFVSREREDIDWDLVDRERGRELAEIALRELERLDMDRRLSGEVLASTNDEEW